MELYTTWKALITAGDPVTAWQKFYVYFYQAFVEADRWKQYIEGVGRTLYVTALALILGVTREELANAVASGRPPHSFSEPVGDDGASLGELLSGDDEYEGLCDRLALREAIRSLPPLHRQIVTLRYFRDLSQQQTADILGLTQVKISREEKKIMASLREKCS